MSNVDTVVSPLRELPRPTPSLPTASSSSSVALKPHPPLKLNDDIGAHVTVKHDVPSSSCFSCAKAAEKTRKRVLRTEANKRETSVEEELAALSAWINAWKEKRLAEVYQEGEGKGGLERHTDDIEAAIERRMQKRREAERTRTQQRLVRLLDTIETRLQQSAHQGKAAAPAFVEDEKKIDLRSLNKQENVIFPLTRAPQDAPSPATQALLACERQHLIRRQQLSVEERDARSHIVRRYEFGIEAARLYADENELRTRLVAWEESWYARLVAYAEALHIPVENRSS